MKLILENWRRYLIEEEIEKELLSERGYGFLQKLGSLVGATEDFNYDAPEMPYGGYTTAGEEFIVVQFPDPNNDGEIEGHEQGYSREPDAEWLVRFIDGREEKIKTSEIKTAPHRRGGERIIINRQIGSKIKAKMTESAVANIIREEYQKRGIYLTEEQLNEKMPRWMKRLGKMGAGIALAGTMMGAAAPGQAYAAGPAGDADAPAQQQQAEEEAVSKVVDNGDGTFSYTSQSQMAPGMRSAASSAGASAARRALQDAGHDLAGSRISKTATSGGVMYVTVTTAAVGG